MIIKTLDSWVLDDFFGIKRVPETERFILCECEEGEWGGFWRGKTFSDLHRRNLSLSHRGKRQPCLETTKIKISQSNKGKVRTDKHKKFISEKTREVMKTLNQQTYKFISPEGEEFLETTTLAEFSRKHNLNRGCLAEVKNGNRNHHKGWKVFPHPVE